MEDKNKKAQQLKKIGKHLLNFLIEILKDVAVTVITAIILKYFS